MVALGCGLWWWGPLACGSGSVPVDGPGDTETGLETARETGGAPPPCDEGAGPLDAETLEDCDANGVEDAVDLAAGAPDCDENGVLDTCEDVTGCTLWGENQYVQYDLGSLPIVLSAPHGGSLEPDEVPVRAGATAGADLRTVELTQAISEALLERTGRVPHLVFCHLHRHRLDCNRDLEEAAEGNPAAEQAWGEYHHFIESAQGSVLHHFGRGVYVDIHGLASERQNIEVGTLLRGSQLAFSDERLDHPAMALLSSLGEGLLGGTFSQVQRGPQSVGGMLEAGGYAVVPSTGQPDPGLDANGDLNHFYSGGYNTRRHGVYEGGLAGLQLENTWEGVRDLEQSRAAYGAVVADALLSFVEVQLGLDVQSPAQVRVVATDARASERGSPGGVEIQRQGSDAQEVRGTLVVGGTATEGSDYRALERAWVLSPGAPSLEVVIDPLEDFETEGPETVLLSLADVEGAHPVPGEALVHLADTQLQAAWIEEAPPEIEEGTVVWFTVVRDACEGALTVGLDWSPERFPWAPEVATFADGETRTVLEYGQVAEPGEQGRRRLSVAVSPGDICGVGPWMGEMWMLDPDLDAGLARWWPLTLEDRTVPELVAGRVGRVFPDEGPVQVEGPAQDVSSALNFDGVDDVVLLEDWSPGSAFSLSFSFRGDAAAAQPYQYLWSQGTVTWTHSLNVYLNGSGTLRTGLRGKEDDWDYAALEVAGDWRDDAWHHYALVVRDGHATVYLDGVQVAAASLGAGGLDPKRRITLGARGDLHPERHFQGALAGVRAWNRALEPVEVALLASSSLP